jgi:hypothetical protein
MQFSISNLQEMMAIPTAVTTCEHCLAFGGSDFTGTHSAPVSGPHS